MATPGGTETSPRPAASSRVCLVSDQRAWAADLLGPVLTIGGVSEVIGWAQAGRLRGPFDALLADVQGSPREKAKLFERWATRAWQPATVVLLRPVRGSAELATLLAELGYGRVGHIEGSAAPDEVADLLRPVLERRLWVVGLFARELRSTEPLFLRVMTCALDDRAPAPTVREWATRCRRDGVPGVATVDDLRSLLHRLGTASPKPLLDRLRLAQVIAHAQGEPLPTREVLARRFGYASGDFLGRTAKRLAGAPFGELRCLDVARAISRLVATG